jgi:hypothetical protein
MSASNQHIPRKFPFRDVFESFLERYSTQRAYWYVPKSRAISDENILAIKGILEVVFEEFIGETWNTRTQDRLLRRLIKKDILDPYKPRGTLTDRTALPRILKKLIESLGLLWVPDGKEIVITDAGLDLLVTENPRLAIERQIVKYQYPNPSLAGPYSEEFTGIIPHLFLLQVLQSTQYNLTFMEFELFLNLARNQDDLALILEFIQHWRSLSEIERGELLDIVRTVPCAADVQQAKLFEEEEPEGTTRYLRIHQNASYQRSFYCYPAYLSLARSAITCEATSDIDRVLSTWGRSLKVGRFESLADWISYYGDPKQAPSWFSYLSREIDRSSTAKEAREIIDQHRDQLAKDEEQQIRRHEVEKSIEEFYVKELHLLENGLRLVADGRQYVTPIGKIDLLCLSKSNEYVVVEIKVDEATDSVFGQILRYIGYVHRNIAERNQGVRGMIVASHFPDTARYSRIGLLKDDHEKFLQFKKHGLKLSDS